MDEFVRPSKRPKINLDPELTYSSAAISVKEFPGIKSYDEFENETQRQDNDKTPKSPIKSKPPKFKIPIPKTKKQWIIASVVIVLLLLASGVAIYWFIIRDNTPPAPVVKSEPAPPPDPGPVPIYSPTSGREVDISVKERPVYAVQIENSPEARPQSGLSEADIVSEAIAEGGITRFNAIFHDNVPANIGPVRSLRPYYIDWFLPYDAAIVHAGGSGEAINDIRALGLKDLDHSNSEGILQRASNRFAPHNLYTTGAKVNDLMTKRSYKSNIPTTLTRKVAAPAAAPAAKTVSLNISRALYNVVFTYDPATNSYLRAQAGSPHVDVNTQKQIAPNVVVVPVLGRRLHPDRVHTQYDTVGSGKVYVFQDGNVVEGTWSKTSRSTQWELKDSSGKVIELNPGQTWFSMIESADRVSFAP